MQNDVFFSYTEKILNDMLPSFPFVIKRYRYFLDLYIILLSKHSPTPNGCSCHLWSQNQR